MDYISALETSICAVTFEKANKEVRRLVCTRVPALIEYTSKTSGRSDPEDVITVWDIENEGFRRFKPSKVIDFEVIESV